MKQTSVWLYPDDLAQVVALVGKNRASEFIRDAISRELKRRTRDQAKTESVTPD